jgi:hypothetical protein
MCWGVNRQQATLAEGLVSEGLVSEGLASEGLASEGLVRGPKWGGHQPARESSCVTNCECWQGVATRILIAPLDHASGMVSNLS